MSNDIAMPMNCHWYAWKSTAALSFVLAPTGQTPCFCLAFTALKDGVRRSGFLVVIGLHKGTYALLNAIGLVRGDFLFIPCSIGVDFGLQLTLDARNLIGYARWTATGQLRILGMHV